MNFDNNLKTIDNWKQVIDLSLIAETALVDQLTAHKPANR